jgi:hypothetical protein
MPGISASDDDPPFLRGGSTACIVRETSEYKDDCLTFPSVSHFLSWLQKRLESDGIGLRMETDSWMQSSVKGHFCCQISGEVFAAVRQFFVSLSGNGTQASRVIVEFVAHDDGSVRIILRSALRSSFRTIRFWKPIHCPSNIVNNVPVEDFSEMTNVPPTIIVGGAWIHDSGVLVVLYDSMAKRFLVCSLPRSFHDSVLSDLIPFFYFDRVLHNGKSPRFHCIVIKRTLASI